MRRIVMSSLCAFALMGALCVPHGARAEGPKVLQTFLVEVEPAKVPAYLAKLKELQPMIERMGVPSFRVWQATYAGDNTGSLVIAVEQSDLAAFGSNGMKTAADPELQRWLQELYKAGLGRLVSQSLWVEVTP